MEEVVGNTRLVYFWERTSCPLVSAALTAPILHGQHWIQEERVMQTSADTQEVVCAPTSSSPLQSVESIVGIGIFMLPNYQSGEEAFPCMLIPH